MSRMIWDQVGARYYRTGVSKGALYLYGDPSTENFKPYSRGVQWSGLTNVTKSPSGADSNKTYADNIPYLNLTSAEEFGATIEALWYPTEFEKCNGEAEIAPGVVIGQQKRELFGFSYQTNIGTDINEGAGYEINLIYGCKAAPSESSAATINDSPEPSSMSWEISTTPVEVVIEGESYRPTSIVTINSLRTPSNKLKALEDILYGTETIDGRLPLPSEVYTLVGTTDAVG